MATMRNLLIKFPERTLKELADLAEQQGVPRAQVIREWAECPLRIGPERLRLVLEHARQEGVVLARVITEALDLYIREKGLGAGGPKRRKATGA